MESVTESLDYVEKSGQSLHQAELLANQLVAEGEKIASVTPGLVQRMVAAGLIDSSEKSAAADKLASHVGATELIQNLLDIRDSEHREFNRKLAAAGSGSAVAPTAKVASVTKDASANPTSGGYVGRHRGAGEYSEADMAMASSLGIVVG